MQNLVSVTRGDPVVLCRYHIDWLGNLKSAGEAHVVPPQAEDFDKSVEAFRLGGKVADAVYEPPIAA